MNTNNIKISNLIFICTFSYRTFQKSCIVWQRGIASGKRKKIAAVEEAQEEVEVVLVEDAGEPHFL